MHTKANFHVQGIVTSITHTKRKTGEPMAVLYITVNRTEKLRDKLSVMLFSNMLANIAALSVGANIVIDGDIIQQLSRNDTGKNLSELIMVGRELFYWGGTQKDITEQPAIALQTGVPVTKL